jgi:hypothetical protein
LPHNDANFGIGTLVHKTIGTVLQHRADAWSMIRKSLPRI